MMRKAVTNGNLPGKEGSGRRYWMRAAPMAPKALPNEGPGKRPPKARFLEPYRLSEERRAALIEFLANGGIGDGESRELFASAIEYDIANARQALAREPPPPAAEPPIPAPVPALAPEALPEPPDMALALPADLAYTARSLAERIAGLEGPVRNAIVESLQGQDRFHRSYDGAYLDALCAELTRLADAVACQPQCQSQQPTPATILPSDPVPPPPEPPLGEGARRFLRRVARVYEEVLESPANPQTDDTFLAVLGLVSGEAGILLPREPAKLTEVLEGA
jgi:hypothetical protein